MLSRLYRVLMFPEGAEGGGESDPPGDDNPPAEGDDDNPPADDDNPPEPDPRPRAKPAAAKKVQIPADRLKDLEDKAKKFEDRERTDREAADAKERARIKQQQEKDPAAALSSLQRKYTSDTSKLQKENDTLKSELDGLRSELAAGELNKKISEALSEALKVAKLEPNSDRANPRMIGEIAAQMTIERQADGSYEIFSKDDGSELSDVVKGLVAGDFKEVYLKPRRSEPARAGDSRRREPDGDGGAARQRTWREAFAERQELHNQANGYIPSTGLKPKAQGK